MFGALNLFFVIEAAYRNCIATVRQTGKEAGQGQADIARIIGFTEAFLFDVFGTVHIVRQVLNTGDFFHAFFTEERWADRADERHVRRGGDA